MRSTSVHWLNAGKDLTPAQRRLWLLLNRINNSFFPHRHGKHLEVRRFHADTSGELWSQTSPRSSPAEKLMDLFWLQLPWERIMAELGALHVLDIRCGAGSLLPRLQGYSEGNVASYTGVDAHVHSGWADLSEQYPAAWFKRHDEAHVSAFLSERTNLIVSQSAVHQIEADLTFFRHIREALQQSGNETIQVHFMPARVALALDGQQGVRQYSPRTASLIAQLFRPFSYSTLYALGGRASSAVHWKLVNGSRRNENQEDVREARPQEYDRRLRQAILRDNRQQGGEPHYYALVIHSHYQQPIFDGG